MTLVQVVALAVLGGLLAWTWRWVLGVVYVFAGILHVAWWSRLERKNARAD